MEKDSIMTHGDGCISGIADTGRGAYEAPAIEELGSIADLTTTDFSFDVG